MKLQNAFLLLSSYVFYGWWDWRFLSLIIASSAVDYLCGLKMRSTSLRADAGSEAISSGHTSLRLSAVEEGGTACPDSSGTKQSHQEKTSLLGRGTACPVRMSGTPWQSGREEKRLLQVDSDSNNSESADNLRNDASVIKHSRLPSSVSGLFHGRKLYLTLSLVFNLGLLGFFKYFNFFIDSAADLISTIGFQPHISTLNLILPVGISFYTFQTLSYSIDVYRGKLKPTKDPIAFFTFVAFFPQLVAGPIERASNLLPQFFKKREFEYQQGSDGMKLILWGLFKKMVIADNCALIVNPIFDNYQTASGLELIMGAVLFAFQIYGDFSGYSDIAIGVAKLFGFDLMTNFRTPYFSRDIAEFWRRWHISLSTWFRDYVYIPLGGSRVPKAKAIRNIFIVFLVSGFWHGANWTFIVWGGIHAALFIPIFLIGKNRAYLHEGEHLLPSFKEVAQMLLTFSLVCVAWVFFRADTVGDAWGYFGGLFSNAFLPSNFAWFGYDLRVLLFLFIILEWVGRIQFNWLEVISRKWYRYPIYVGVMVVLIWFGANEQQFIYFQF
ncbi:MBOAT family O-acyltransferase [Algoriphagus sp. C2-6-M1]|uniref:MBOAT family O-acyltransferase n=1 Tax=Algoriphagus persicinus TaxID=3108754 RepID=UPI003A5D0FFC